MSGDERVAPASKGSVHSSTGQTARIHLQHSTDLHPFRVTVSWIPDSLVYSGLQIRIMAKI